MADRPVAARSTGPVLAKDAIVRNGKPLGQILQASWYYIMLSYSMDFIPFRR